jgi:hypothetical protein
MDLAYLVVYCGAKDKPFIPMRIWSCGSCLKKSGQNYDGQEVEVKCDGDRVLLTTVKPV